MSIIFENTNKEMPLEIAKETMKAHRLRNIIACLAISLTTILITVICGAGISTMKALIIESKMVPGPGTKGSGIYGSVKTLKAIRKQPEVVWADIARHCTIGTPRNKEFAGLEVNFLAVSKTYYQHHYIDLICGTYPRNAKEILMSSRLAEKTGRDLIPGQEITLNLIIKKNGENMESPVSVTICGFYQDPLDIEYYEELYTTQDFPDQYNPELNDKNSKIYVKLATSKKDWYKDLNKLCKVVQGISTFYTMPVDIKTEKQNFILFVFIVMASGYFLIYNIFYISIVNDVHFIGNMKTLGMTGKQIHTMLNWQIYQLGMVGIITGLFIGTGCNLFVISFLKNDSNISYSRYYEVYNSLLLAALSGAIFSIITVWISSNAALSIVKKISPIEASKFHSSGKRKIIFAIISFALSGTLFCGIFTTLIGYDVDYMVQRTHESDYKIYQNHAIQTMKKPYQPMSETFVKKICALDFIKESYIYHMARDLNEAPLHGLYPESISFVRLSGRFLELIRQEFSKLGIYTQKDTKDFAIGILGMDPEALHLEMQNLDLYDGTVDAKLFASGNYLLYRPLNDKATYIENGIKPEEEINLSFYDFSQKKYITKTLKVMAIVGTKLNNIAGNISNPIQIIIPNSLFEEIYGDLATQMISCIQLNTIGKDWNMEQERIKQIITEEFNEQILLSSRYEYRLKEEKTKLQQIELGLLAGFFIGLIGLINIINTIITNVLSRKLEFATLQSIGMTTRQMTVQIWFYGIRMILISLFIIFPAGYYAANIFTKIFLGINPCFTLSAYFLSYILILITGILSSIIVGYVLTRILNKKPMVERLREGE